MTCSAEELCASPDIDVAFITNPDASHVHNGILALQRDKYYMIEKPASFCFRDINRLIEAEKVFNGRVVIGAIRHYAHAFLNVVREVGGIEKII